jgi:hypothetical protein
MNWQELAMVSKRAKSACRRVASVVPLSGAPLPRAIVGESE